MYGVKAGIGKTILPQGLNYPDHWHEAPDVDEDSIELIDKVNTARRAWLRQRND